MTSPAAMPLSPASENGFTLVEMLVVLTIIGLLAAVAIASLRPPAFLGRGKLQTTLAAAAAAARLDAQASGRPASIDLRGERLAGISFRPDPGFTETAPTFYPDGSSTGGSFSLKGQAVAKLDWATGRLADAAR